MTILYLILMLSLSLICILTIGMRLLKKHCPKDIKIFAQNDNDATEIRSAGFKNILKENTVFEGIQLIKTKGEHGRGEILQHAGQVCGVIFKHSKEKTLYFTGDTVWYEAVQETIDTHKPEIIVVNAR
ncbi:hypothetical protein SRABI80_04193 [Peribacillus frigoritolerans]|nr:hypothetical protein SRABI80_04193 [Peribacillus frigoritolerans]